MIHLNIPQVRSSLLVLFLAWSAFAQAQPVLPYHATPGRKKQILVGYESVSKGMTLAQVEETLGKADYVTPLYEPRVKNALQIGFTHWYLIQQLKETGSVMEVGRLGVALRTDKKGVVLGADFLDIPSR